MEKKTYLFTFYKMCCRKRMDVFIVKSKTKIHINPFPNQDPVHTQYLLGKGETYFSYGVSLGVSPILQGPQTPCPGAVSQHWPYLTNYSAEPHE